MTRIELPPDIVEKLRAAAAESTDAVGLTDADGVVLLEAPPTAGAAISREEIDAIIARRDDLGPTFTHAEVMQRLWAAEVEREKAVG